MKSIIIVIMALILTACASEPIYIKANNCKPVTPGSKVFICEEIPQPPRAGRGGQL